MRKSRIIGKLTAAVLLPALAFGALTAEAKPGGHDGGLPPGLQKKVSRGGSLPPGWQNDLEVGRVLDDEVYAHGEVVVPVGEHGAVTVEVGGRLLRLHRQTREILDILR